MGFDILMRNGITDGLKMPIAVVIDASKVVDQLCMMIEVSVVNRVATQVGLVRTLPQRNVPMLMHATHSHRNKCDDNEQGYGGCAEAQSLQHKARA